MKRQKDGVVVLGAALGSEDFVGDYYICCPLTPE